MKRDIWMIPRNQAFLRKRAPKARNRADWLPVVNDLNDTWETVAAHGIAAPQIGVSRRIFIFRPFGDDSSPPEAIINPKIIRAQGELKDFDGCLSVPRIYGPTRRAELIELTGVDVNGNHIRRTYEGFTARIIQHEFDHLDGILFIDRLDSLDDCYTLAPVEEMDEKGNPVERHQEVPLTEQERGYISQFRVKIPGHALSW